jgi:hypothetical protein
MILSQWYSKCYSLRHSTISMPIVLNIIIPRAYIIIYIIVDGIQLLLISHSSFVFFSRKVGLKMCAYCLKCCLMMLFVIALRCFSWKWSNNAILAVLVLALIGSFSCEVNWILLLRFRSFSNINAALGKFHFQRLLRCFCICKRITGK